MQNQGFMIIQRDRGLYYQSLKYPVLSNIIHVNSELNTTSVHQILQDPGYGTNIYLLL